jgi:hypothetical protein
LAKFRVWGCLCYTHIPKETRHKLDAIGEPRIFVGYESELHQYRLFNPETGKIERSINVDFFETETWGSIDSDQFALRIPEGEDELENHQVVELSVEIAPKSPIMPISAIESDHNIDSNTVAATRSASDVFTTQNDPILRDLAAPISQNEGENDISSRLVEIDENQLPSDALDAQLGGVNQTDPDESDVDPEDDDTIVVDVGSTNPGFPLVRPVSRDPSVRRSSRPRKGAPERYDPPLREKKDQARFAEQPEHLLHHRYLQSLNLRPINRP